MYVCTNFWLVSTPFHAYCVLREWGKRFKKIGLVKKWENLCFSKNNIFSHFYPDKTGWDNN